MLCEALKVVFDTMLLFCSVGVLLFELGFCFISNVIVLVELYIVLVGRVGDSELFAGLVSFIIIYYVMSVIFFYLVCYFLCVSADLRFFASVLILAFYVILSPINFIFSCPLAVL